MALDYKKEQKEFYQPKTVPSIVNVPMMTKRLTEMNNPKLSPLVRVLENT
jgi:hypothetical protein